MSTKLQIVQGERSSIHLRLWQSSAVIMLYTSKPVPSSRSILCTGEYRAAVNKIAEHASSLLVICKSHGLKVPVRCSILQHFPADSVKFFLKEQQKMLEDLHNTGRAGLHASSCTFLNLDIDHTQQI